MRRVVESAAHLSRVYRVRLKAETHNVLIIQNRMNGQFCAHIQVIFLVKLGNYYIYGESTRFSTGLD